MVTIEHKQKTIKMYEAIENFKDGLSDIKMRERKDGKTGHYYIGRMTNETIRSICQGAADITPASSKGWDFYFSQLSKQDWLKLLVICKRLADSEKVEAEINLLFVNTLSLLTDIIVLPCSIASKAEEIGYLNAVEEEIGFYLDRDSFEEAHSLSHEVMEEYSQLSEDGGWIRNYNILRN